MHRMPGFPIRISTDLRLLASPRSVSPLAASFIGALSLGIHHTPFVACNIFSSVFILAPSLDEAAISYVSRIRKEIPVALFPFCSCQRTD